jgi:hypothetical protein
MNTPPIASSQEWKASYLNLLVKERWGCHHLGAERNQRSIRDVHH